MKVCTICKGRGTIYFQNMFIVCPIRGCVGGGITEDYGCSNCSPHLCKHNNIVIQECVKQLMNKMKERHTQ